MDPTILDPVLLTFDPGRATQKAKYLGELFTASAIASGDGFSFLEFFQINSRGWVLTNKGGPMWGRRTKKKPVVSEESWSGGIDIKTLLSEWAVFEEVCHRMDNERAALLKRYPREWVAVGKGGLIDHSESVEDLVDSVQSRGVRSWEYQLKFLDPHPPLFLL